MDYHWGFLQSQYIVYTHFSAILDLHPCDTPLESHNMDKAPHFPHTFHTQKLCDQCQLCHIKIC